ncbi:hypothetical protein CHS0354_024007 [Potamilus streckersoni]|uniref:Uncharacterized protein n=1 Tax=Potamilus streckersoni TaxID=2493646 RepID=A0AAE0S025_9BIVA|nr:hypothetical protein CHS0354_024007 [Potamilus streckersoni]
MKKVIIIDKKIENKKVDTIPLHPIFLTPLIDTTKPPYKRITTFEYPFKSNISMEGVDIDMLPHRSAEDLFQWNHHTYLRDKFEFGQINELLVNGLGRRYQQIVLDDILVNDPLTMMANWQMLTTEEFSRFEVMRGFESFSRGTSPITVDFQTADYVAALGYTHLRFQDYNSKSTQVNGAFTVNFSDRFNFFGNYTIETNSGLRKGGIVEPNPFALHHKINIRFRYEFAPRTYFILSGRYNELNLLPFGGYNLEDPSNRANFRQTSFFGTPANPNSKSKFSIGIFKMEMILPTFKTSTSDNQLKIWVSTALFNQNYFVAARAIDTAFSIRSQMGLNQALDFDFLKLNGRIELVWDNISNQNLVKTPVANATSLTGSILSQLIFNEFLPNTDFKASLSGSVNQINRIPKYDAAPVYSSFQPSFGGDVKFTFKISDGNIRFGLFGNANFSSRLSALDETYGRDTLVVGIGAEAAENIQNIGQSIGYQIPVFFKLPPNLIRFGVSWTMID